jgi:hypothetical protein
MLQIGQYCPWYEPSEKLLDQPIITATMQTDFDTVVVQGPSPRTASAAGS